MNKLADKVANRESRGGAGKAANAAKGAMEGWREPSLPGTSPVAT